MPKKIVNKEEQVEDVEDVESEDVEEEESEKEEVDIQPKQIIKKKTNRKLTLKEQAEVGNTNIEKIVAYKKKTSEKQAEHMKKARKANKEKIENTKKKLNNYDLLVKENELLKRELEMGTRKKSFRAPIEKKEGAPVKKVQIQEPPKPNFYGLM